MTRSFSLSGRRWAAAHVGALALTLTLFSVISQAQVATGAGPIVAPVRRAADAPPTPPPSLPPGADQVGSLTLDMVTRRHAADGPGSSTRQVMTRTSRRVHIKVDADREWLFVRNPVDSRRVEGLLVVHSRRTIVMYDESGVRNWLGLRGWADVLTLGLDMHALSQLTLTGDVRSEAGLRFARYTTAADPSAAVGQGVREVWWCTDQALPLQFTKQEAAVTTVVSVERIRTTVGQEELALPAERFPEYRVIDLAEWLEDL